MSAAIEVSRSLQEARALCEERAENIGRMAAALAANAGAKARRKRLDWGDAGDLGRIETLLRDAMESAGLGDVKEGA